MPTQLTRTDFADAYAVRLPPDTSTDPREWAQRLFANTPRWVHRAMVLRDRLVSVVGLKAAGRMANNKAAMPFPEQAHTEREVIRGFDDRHLDFRSCIHVEETDDGVQLTIGTVVHFHNLFGRLYFLPVRPLHALIIHTMLHQAAAHPAIT
ncbi:hypothetical protein JOF56_010018 [Kibdelosporangium banguiense]|uniref:DUF2867 domain-containing protein n=1 Tax=Kibdelosporangium banguiense TaxID=1365924 RepID=A0ABS4U067_9PSEU|nr:DUF2867 domain-containing protein [Kibdelosporangium banguiense]MBP2329633.1 hypothetical protein [Kibdelosporangium banguiense]